MLLWQFVIRAYGFALFHMAFFLFGEFYLYLGLSGLPGCLVGGCVCDLLRVF